MKPIQGGLQQPRINLSQTSGILCEACDHNVFVPAFFLRKVSRFVSQTPQDVISPIQVFACNVCGHVNDEFNPLKAEETTEDSAA